MDDTVPPAPSIDWDGDPDVVKAELADLFPGMHIIYTTTGWWATQSSLTREDMHPGDDLRADTARGLFKLLLTVPRRISRSGGPGGGINV